MNVYFHALPYRYAALLTALTWGNTQYLSSYDYSLFKEAGVLHLVVLSGQNIVLLTSLIIAFLPRKRLIYTATTCLIASIYWMLYPRQAPIVRASCMAIIGSISIGVRQYQPRLAIFFLSLVFLLVLHPTWLTEISFLLSCGATLGIVLAQKYMRHSYIHDTLLQSTFATIGVLPISLLVFRSFHPIGIVVTTCILWLIAPLMALGIIAYVLSFLYEPLAHVVLFPAHGILFLCISVIEISAKIGRYTTLTL